MNNKCPIAHCTNEVKKGGKCSTCRSRETRQRDPIRYIWLNLKNRAKQRPKEFTITLEEFRQWVIDNEFVPGQGWSIDRKNNEHGYHIWNIQKMLLIDNINKYHKYDKHYKPVETDVTF